MTRTQYKISMALFAVGCGAVSCELKYAFLLYFRVRREFTVQTFITDAVSHCIVLLLLALLIISRKQE